VNTRLKSALFTSLVGFGAVITGKLIIQNLVPYQSQPSLQEHGILKSLSSYNISFPKDYITFIIIGGIVWPWLQEKTGWSNELMYFLGGLTFLYIISSDGKYLLPKRNYEYHYEDHEIDNQRYRRDKLINYPENTIKKQEYKYYGDKTMKYPFILSASIYSVFFYGILLKSLVNSFSKASNIYPFIKN